jgi:hypothetical protein
MSDLKKTSGSSHSTSHPPILITHDLRWDEETRVDTINFDDMAGLVFVRPKSSTETVSAESLRNILNTDLPIKQHPSVNGAYRIVVSETRGREGVMAVSSFLNRVPPTLNQRLIVSREKTRLTLLRGKCMKPINNAVKQVITTTPSLRGLKTHMGSNNSSLFLSYAERKEALDYRNKSAPAYVYPVWQHIPYEPTMNNGRGGFDFFTCTNLDHNTILNTIMAMLPNPPDTEMTDATRARVSRGRDPSENQNEGRSLRQNTGQTSRAGHNA